MPQEITLTIPDFDGIETPEDIENACERATDALWRAQGVSASSPHDDYEAGMGDLIANILHLAERDGCDPLDVLRSAVHHYGAGRVSASEPYDLGDGRYDDPDADLTDA